MPFSAISKRRLVDRAQCGMDVAGAMAVDLADEAQGEMELILALPARAADPAHRGEQQLADRRGRPDGDEQPVHGVPSRSSGKSALGPAARHPSSGFP